MFKKVKRIMVLTVLLVVMLFPMNVFAYETGSANIILSLGTLWASGRGVTNSTSINNLDSGTSTFAAPASSYHGALTEVSGIFNFSANNNYGILEITCNATGNTVTSEPVVMYDYTSGSNGAVIARWNVSTDVFRIQYRGNIPSKFKIAFYTSNFGTVEYIAGTYTDVTYSPISVMEQEEQKAEQQGEASINEGVNAIEDKGGAFVDSMAGLISSMSYTGTECAWTFPQVKMPAINGVMDEVVLIQSQPIDFSQWVNGIPSDILKIVQSVCTAGLIVFCFKECYSTIAYVLTLRKDENS